MTSGVRICPVTGPPGAGKTTGLLSLAKQHRWLARFGVRDYGLDLARAGHPLGLAMRDSLLRGVMLSDALVREEFVHFLHHLPDDVRVVAVEGYPRDQAQSADFFDAVREARALVGGLVVVDIPDELVWARVAQRLICAGCGRPVQAAGQCPTCAGPVVRRGDDARDRLSQRLRDYRRLSAEVNSYFAERHLLRIVDGTRQEIDVRQALHEMLTLT